MKTFSGMMARFLFGLQIRETKYARRGFRGATEEMRTRLEQIGEAFLAGYHAALEHSAQADLVGALNGMKEELRGFTFEGAATGLTLLDWLTPWRRNRIREFLKGAGDAHVYMAHVGVGWIWARLPVNFRQARQCFDPVLGWMAFDGWGFYEGYFHWTKYRGGQPLPRRLIGYERRVFDHGLGRAFWFVNGGNPALIAHLIGEFPTDRQADLWSGAGLGASYAGVVEESVLRDLRTYAGPHWPQLAQGSAFAAKARQRAGNLTDYTNLATGVFCGMSALDAARLCDQTLENLPANADPPAFEIWRRRIQNHFAPTRQSQQTR